MPSLNAGDLITCLLTKLRATELPGDHRVFEVYDDAGRLVARTKVSRSWRGTTPIGPLMVTLIARQLGVTSSQLAQLARCTLGRDDYLTLASR